MGRAKGISAAGADAFGAVLGTRRGAPAPYPLFDPHSRTDELGRLVTLCEQGRLQEPLEMLRLAVELDEPAVAQILTSTVADALAAETDARWRSGAQLTDLLGLDAPPSERVRENLRECLRAALAEPSYKLGDAGERVAFLDRLLVVELASQLAARCAEHPNPRLLLAQAMGEQRHRELLAEAAFRGQQGVDGYDQLLSELSLEGWQRLWYEVLNASTGAECPPAPSAERPGERSRLRSEVLSAARLAAAGVYD